MKQAIWVWSFRQNIFPGCYLEKTSKIGRAVDIVGTKCWEFWLCTSMSKLLDFTTWDEKHHTEHQDHAAQHQRGQAAEPRAALVAAACNKQIIITAVNGTSRNFAMSGGFYDFSFCTRFISQFIFNIIISIFYYCNVSLSTITIRHLRSTHSSQCSTALAAYCDLWNREIDFCSTSVYLNGGS